MLFLLPSVAYAQGDSLLAKFYKSTEESCVEFEYKYSVRISGVNQVGSGVLVAQENIWKLVGNGLEMYFDGKPVDHRSRHEGSCDRASSRKYRRSDPD